MDPFRIRLVWITAPPWKGQLQQFCLTDPLAYEADAAALPDKHLNTEEIIESQTGPMHRNNRPTHVHENLTQPDSDSVNSHRRTTRGVFNFKVCMACQRTG